MKNSDLKELLNTRMNKVYILGFDDSVITEMVNMVWMNYDQFCVFFLL